MQVKNGLPFVRYVDNMYVSGFNLDLHFFFLFWRKIRKRKTDDSCGMTQGYG